MSASINFGRKRLAIDIRLKKDGDGWRIDPICNNRKMTTSEFILLLKNPKFSERFSQKILDIPSKAISICSTHISDETKDEPISFLIEEDPLKKGMYPNYSPFSRSMNNWGYAHSMVDRISKSVIVFPHASDRDFSHLITFLKNSDEDERAALWSKVADEVNISSRNLQIKTTFERIPWFNIHICS